MVHPLVEQITDRQEAHLGVMPAAQQIGGTEAGNEWHAVGAQRGKLVPEAGPVAAAVIAGTRDGLLVPALESGLSFERMMRIRPAKPRFSVSIR